MQNKLSISNTFVGGRNYLCDKRYIFELSFGVFVIRVFTELWLCSRTSTIKQHHNEEWT